eukprot:326118-Pleurochrysis_carterae.AAC.3
MRRRGNPPYQGAETCSSQLQPSRKRIHAVLEGGGPSQKSITRKRAESCACAMSTRRARSVSSKSSRGVAAHSRPKSMLLGLKWSAITSSASTEHRTGRSGEVRTCLHSPWTTSANSPASGVASGMLAS